MKPSHLGFLCALVLGGSELAAKNTFRKIYDKETDTERRRTLSMSYLEGKIVGYHQRDQLNGEERDYKRDLYLFKRFAKLYLVNPASIEEATGPEAPYKAFRATTMFMLRTANPMWGDNNEIFLTDLVTKISALRSIANAGGAEFQLTTDLIEAWVNDARTKTQSQVKKGSESRAKGLIVQSWSVWVKKPETRVASQLQIPKVSAEDSADEIDWGSPRTPREEQ